MMVPNTRKNDILNKREGFCGNIPANKSGNKPITK